MKHLRVVGVILSVLLLLAVGCVVQTPEGSPEELLAQADALLDQGRAADALPLIEAALAQEDSAQGRFFLGNAYGQEERLEDAEAEYLKALELDPDFVDARANLAVVYYEAGRLSEAEGAVRRALEAQPEDADLHYNLGGVLAAQGRFPEAESELLIARDLDPDLPEVHLGLGMLYRDLGRRDEALDSLRRYLEISDDPEWRAEAEALIAALEAE